MAINVEVLKTRALTAVVFVAVMLTGLLWNQYSFILLFTIVHFGCWYEFVKLMKKIHGAAYLKYCLLGLIYITLPVLLLINLRLVNALFIGNSSYDGFGIFVSCTIIFSIWINDTMAYIVGSLIGRTPFSKISPKKTWEGTAGGAVLCIMAIGIAAYFIFSVSIFVGMAAGIAAICAIFGTAGDLLESKIKRMADVKDSGSIMPGHGGFLDRFDSLLVAVPFVWLFVWLYAMLFM
jgi:phosphatidate cytidylyltransferase